jgi:hypothetical protein
MLASATGVEEAEVALQQRRFWRNSVVGDQGDCDWLARRTALAGVFRTPPNALSNNRAFSRGSCW